MIEEAFQKFKKWRSNLHTEVLRHATIAVAIYKLLTNPLFEDEILVGQMGHCQSKLPAVLLYSCAFP